MILFELKCASEHHFEAWFRDGGAYEAQAVAGTIVCPHCGDARVSKAPMAPRIARSRGKGEESMAVPESKTAKDQQADVMRQLGELRRKVEENCDYVGDRFTEEARRIHYGEADPRGIYGEASAGDVAELQEEGVVIHHIPWLPRTDS